MDTSSINTEYYKVFYYVGRLGSITAAAEALCISQPAVSQAVKQLEKALNSQLFIRTQKGVRLTAEGELLFPYVERGIENLLDGERMLRRLVDLDMGEVRIGASDMTLQFYLLPHLERFHGRYPNIKVMVSNAPTPETIQSLYEGRIDFGVVSTPFDARPEVEALPVKKIRNTFVAGHKFWEPVPEPQRKTAGVRGFNGPALYLSGEEYQYPAVYGPVSGRAGRFFRAGV